MNAVRRLRLQMKLSQVEFAVRLGVAEQTYRTWDSGRRTPPRSIVSKAKRLQETGGGLLPMQLLAGEYLLRHPSQDDRPTQNRARVLPGAANVSVQVAAPFLKHDADHSRQHTPGGLRERNIELLS